MRILMVCLGNICRSPLAEGILKEKIKKKGLNGWQVDSAGTGYWHVGEMPDHRSVHVARRHAIDITGQRARLLSREDFDRFDRIFVMDRSNLRDVLLLAPNPENAAKADLILNQLYPGEDREVPDPYYDDDGFEGVFQMLDNACERIVEMGC